MANETEARNKESLRVLPQDAMPNGRFDVIEQLVTKDAVTRRAGLANLFVARGASIPEKGNFLQWVRAGWKPLLAALSDQKMTVEELVGDGDTVMMRFRMNVLHSGEFVGMPATGQRIEWEEIAVARFNADGRIADLWFMCEELKMAQALGLELTAQ
ncbi:ester cyclase [Paracoccus sp. M683]|uniref:ester cyclase n=1 Tax=Paracoccus sp. M683 TaxID=2594268 RepID=UPI00117D70E9|nr:ester cyclase [Paracoccus sp. M683]TRW97828.1 ester cyclase [Paracoccus sp. M683]